MLDRISTFAGSLQRDYLMQSAQAQLSQVANEVASGQKADPAGALGTSAAMLYQLHYQFDQQSALQTSTGLASQRLDTIQTAMDSIGSVAQNMATASLNLNSATGQGLTVLAGQARDAMAQAQDALNTQFDGAAVFAGDAGTSTAAQAADAPGGPINTINAVLNAAVTAKGGALSAADVPGLLTGPDGLGSVFSNTNSNPALNYNTAFSTVPAGGNPIKVLVGASQTVQYDVNSNQPAFTDLMQGLSMLSMLDAPSSQLDDSAKSALLTQGNALINQAQSELTTQQGQLGVTQATLQSATDLQQAAATATQQRLATYEQANTTADSTTLTALETQLQASYEVTAQISQLSLTHYLPAIG